MKRALVLSGGGANGAFQVGVIKKLHSEGLKFDFVSGVSVGAVNAMLVAQNKIEELEELWLGIKDMGDIFKSNYLRFFSGFCPLFPCHSALYKPGPILNLIEEYCRNEFLMEFQVGATDLTSGDFVISNQNDSNISKMVLASVSLPLLLPPVNINGHSFVDGGIRDNKPLKSAIEFGADEIHVVLLRSSEVDVEPERFKNPVRIGIRSLQIMTNEFYEDDIETCLHKNHLDEFRHIDIVVHEAENLGNILDFSEERIRKVINLGEESTAMNLTTIDQGLVDSNVDDRVGLIKSIINKLFWR